MTAQLLYFVDPMCSWCWGFAPVFAQIRQEYAERMSAALIMGGLRPWTKEPMGEADKAGLAKHWAHVAEASGQPFDLGFFARERFIYDTEPAARAVVVAGRLLGAPAFGFLEAVQRAFYAENRDVTQVDVLAEIAAEQGLERGAFAAAFASEAAKQETIGHFQTSQRLGVRGFPTLAAVAEDRQAQTLTAGFAPVETVRERLEAYLEG